MARVVVVGAGVGGLAAAARLAVLGHDVTVCEQAGTIGGKLGWYARDGFAFDTGPSLLTMPDVFVELFAATGDPLPAVLDLAPLDPIARYRFADGTVLDAPGGGPDRFADAAAAAFGEPAGEDWRRLAERAGRMWAASRGPFLTAPQAGPAALARLALRRPADVAVIAPGRSLRALGRRYLRDPRLQMVLDRYATYSGSDPRRAPAALAVVPYVEQTYGGWYVRGGLRRLGLALADRARERGARLLTGCPVAAVELAGGAVDGVRLADGHRLPADVVVATADASRLYGGLVVGPAAARAARRLSRVPPSLAGFVLLLALRGRTPGLGHHTVLFPAGHPTDQPADYDAEFDAVFDPAAHGGGPAADPTIYVAAPPDPGLAPDGCEAWFVLVNAARHGTAPGCLDWDAGGLADRYAGRVLDLLAARGLDVRDRLLWHTVRTPADLERETGASGGAIYGTSSHGPAAAFLRPANRSPVPGLFLAGGSAHPGGGLPLVAISAKIVAGLVGPA